MGRFGPESMIFNVSKCACILTIGLLTYFLDIHGKDAAIKFRNFEKKMKRFALLIMANIIP